MDENKKKEVLAQLNNAGADDILTKNLNIVFTDAGDDFLEATMPVSSKVHQPFGIMHGGASCVLAESLGSCLSLLFVDHSKEVPVGTSLNTYHLRAKRSGTVTGKATFIRKGTTVHVSQIEIRDEKGNLINQTTMTNNIVPISKIS